MKQRASWTLGAMVAVSFSMPSIATAAETILEDFEASDSISNWEFSTGQEFPGATGSFSVSTGHIGKGARLTYDLTAGGRYVSASLKFETPVETELIALALKQPARSQAKLRLYDASGQTFEYSIARPLEAFEPSTWFRVVIDVHAFTGSYGGRGDGILQQPLTGISVLAIPEFEVVGAPSGVIEFDELTTVDEQRVTLDLDSLPMVPAPEGAEELAPRLAVNFHTTNDERELDQARAAGFSKIRVDLGWSDIETAEGRYDFSRFDALLSELSARGMRMHLILDYLNPLYPGFGDSEFLAVTLPAFAAVSRATAEHFRDRNVSYEIWNEPNSPTFWSATADDFALLSAAAAKAVREGDPSAEICTGGVSGFDYRFVSAYLKAGGGLEADAIGVHPYRRGGAETAGHDLLLMRAIIREHHGTILPVWDTEWGYSSSWFGDGHASDSRKRQAQMVTRELLSAWALGFPLAVYYDIRDGGSDPNDHEHNFGLLQRDYGEKPAMLAVRRLTQVAKGRRYVGLVNTGLSSLHALRLDGGEGPQIVLWWDDPKRSVNVVLPAGTLATDFLGNEVRLPSGSAPTLTLDEPTGPLYLELARRAQTSGAGGSAGRSSTGTSSALASGGTLVIGRGGAGGAGGAGGGTSTARGGSSARASGGSAAVDRGAGRSGALGTASNATLTARAGSSARSTGTSTVVANSAQELGVAGGSVQNATVPNGCGCSSVNQVAGTHWSLATFALAAWLRRRRRGN